MTYEAKNLVTLGGQLKRGVAYQTFGYISATDNVATIVVDGYFNDDRDYFSRNDMITIVDKTVSPTRIANIRVSAIVTGGNVQTELCGSEVSSIVAETVTADDVITNTLTTDYVDFNTSWAGSMQEGRMAWGSDEGTIQVGMPGSNVNLDLGQEMLIRAKNVEGAQINKGECVIIFGASGSKPTVKLINNSEIDASEVIAIATEDVADNGNGYFTTVGLLSDIDTSSWTAGDLLYLDSADGQLTNTRPSFPAHLSHVAHCMFSNAESGVIFVHIHHEKGDDLANFFNGTFRETFNALVTATGGVITMSLEQSGGGDLTMQFSDGLTVLDATPAATIALTAGTDNVPKKNFIYIPQATKVLTLSTTAWPTSEHIKIGFFFASSAAKVEADGGVLINQNWNHHLANGDLQGHMSHIAETVRVGRGYKSGIDGAGTDDYTSSSAGVVTIQYSSGVVRQMHNHTVPALDTSVSGNYSAFNAHATDGGTYFDSTNLFDITVDTTGATLNNRYFNIGLFIVANKTGEFAPALISVPNGSYSTLTAAQADSLGHDVLSLPEEFVIDSGTGFSVARLTFRKTGGSWVYQSTVDLRGVPAITATGGSIAPISNFLDSTFSIGNTADNTKIFAVDVSGVTTATTRTLTIPDADGTIALTDVDNAFSVDQSFGGNNITNVGDIALATISSQAGTSINVVLGSDAGDDFLVDTDKFIVSGDTGYVGIGIDPAFPLTVKGVLPSLIEDTGAGTSGIASVLILRETTSGNMVDGFGGRLTFQIDDAGVGAQNIGSFGAIRDGGDAEGALVFYAGTSGEELFMKLTSAGKLIVGAPDSTARALNCRSIYAGTSDSRFEHDEGIASMGGDDGSWARIVVDEDSITIDPNNGDTTVTSGAFIVTTANTALTSAGKLTLNGAVIRKGFIQVYAGSAQTSTGATMNINFTAQTRKDTTYYTHSTSTNTDQITITEAGDYRISYNVNWDSDLADRCCMRAWVTDDGAAIVPSYSYCYIRFNTYGRFGTNSGTFIATIAASSVIRLATRGQAGTGAFGSGCDNDTIANYSWITIEKI